MAGDMNTMMTEEDMPDKNKKRSVGKFRKHYNKMKEKMEGETPSQERKEGAAGERKENK